MKKKLQTSLIAGATTLGSEQQQPQQQHSFPARSRMNTDGTTSDRFTENGGWVDRAEQGSVDLAV